MPATGGFPGPMPLSSSGGCGLEEVRRQMKSPCVAVERATNGGAPMPPGAWTLASAAALVSRDPKPKALPNTLIGSCCGSLTRTWSKVREKLMQSVTGEMVGLPACSSRVVYSSWSGSEHEVHSLALTVRPSVVSTLSRTSATTSLTTPPPSTDSTTADMAAASAVFWSCRRSL